MASRAPGQGEGGPRRSRIGIRALVVVRVEAISQVLPLLLGGRGDGRQRLGGDGAVADGIHAAARVRHAQIVVDLPEITRDDTR